VKQHKGLWRQNSLDSLILAIQLRAVPFAVLAPGGQSGNFWIHPRMSVVFRWCCPE